LKTGQPTDANVLCCFKPPMPLRGRSSDTVLATNYKSKKVTDAISHFW